MTEKKNFWATLPGILTGTATVITAGLGLIGAMNSSGSTGNKEQTVTIASPSPSPTLQRETLFDDFPQADVAPQTLDFSELGVGRAESKSVTVINSGESDLIIDAVELTGESAASFKVAQDTCASETVIPGSRCELTVEFSPSGVGSFHAALELQHNAQDSPTQVPLNGEGVLLDL